MGDDDEVERTDYAPKSSIVDDLRVLKAMWFGNIKGGSHQDQLESFYNKQVSDLGRRAGDPSRRGDRRRATMRATHR